MGVECERQFIDLICTNKDKEGTIERCLGPFVEIMVMYANRLDALLLTYGIDLMRLQRESGLYLKAHRRITDVDSYIGSMELAQKYIDALPKEPQRAQPEQTTDAQSLNPEPEQAAPEPQQEHQEATTSTIPTINDTDKEKFVFGNALQKQYMKLKNGCYIWTLTKSLLAYMCGRLYCGDRIKEDATDYSKEYVRGNTQMSAKEVKALFGGVDVASNRYSIKAPPRNSWKVDELFKNNGASK